MNWNLSCRKTRRLLALSAGNDVEERDLSGTERHLAVCPHCREAWQGLQQAQRALEQVGYGASGGSAPVVSPASGSVWSGVSRQLRTIDARATESDWRGWLPSAALAAACVAVILVALPERPAARDTARRRDLRLVVPELFVGESDPATLRRLPIEHLRATDPNGAHAAYEGGAASLPVRLEPRSF